MGQQGVLQVNLQKNPMLLDNRSCSGEGRNCKESFIQIRLDKRGCSHGDGTVCLMYLQQPSQCWISVSRSFSGKGNIICFRSLHQIFKSMWTALLEAEESTVFPHSDQLKQRFLAQKEQLGQWCLQHLQPVQLFMKGVSVHGLTLGYKSAS